MEKSLTRPTMENWWENLSPDDKKAKSAELFGCDVMCIDQDQIYQLYKTEFGFKTLMEIKNLFWTDQIDINEARVLLFEYASHPDAVNINNKTLAVWKAWKSDKRESQVKDLRALYDEYAIRLSVMKEARSEFSEENGADAEIDAIGTQIALLTGVLSRMNKILQ